MKKIVLTAVIAAMAHLSVNSQALQHCGTNDHQKLIEAADPSITKAREKLERFTQNYSASTSVNRTGQVLITIPVVFHILYNNAAQNISTARIMDQLNVLNNDYAKLNADTGVTPLAFRPIAANTQIQFCLAQQDPNGQPTTGILRIPISTGNPSTFPSNLSAPWSRNSYLNIYVGNFGGILGVAQLPGGPANTDYVNALYTTVGGPNNPGTEPAYDLGRTLTHEIGHWLNLYHTFDGGCQGGNANNCSSSGDNVCDTPPTSGSNFNCPGTQNTCTETSPFPPPYTSDQNDMTVNYMDYVDDECMVMFSQGQANRMVACINGARSSLLQSQGCIPPNVQAVDGGITAIVNPIGALCTSTFTPTITLKNFGTNPLTSVNMNYQIDNGTVQVQPWTGNLASFASVTLNLLPVTVGNGSHTFTSYTTQPNAVTDPNHANDTSRTNFSVGVGQLLPYQQPFTGSASFLPSGWSISNPDNSTTWDYIAGYGHSGNGCMWMDNANYQANGQVDEISMQALDLTGGVSANLSFWVAYTYWTTPVQYSDTLEVLISTNCGVSYNSIYKKWSTALATAPPQSSDFFPTASQWRQETVSLQPYISFNNVILKFRNITDYENNMFVDDINISIVTGIRKLNDNLSISVGPNPNQGKLNVRIDTQSAQQVDFKIFNAVGSLLMDEKIGVTSAVIKQFDISKFPNGIYHLTVTTNGQTYTEKLVLNR